MSKTGCRSGFTLIELSIVLVIIGLIVGGVMTGQSLIKAAQVRQSLKAVEQINSAVNTFKSKYNCLPGDCANITNVFTLRADCDPGNNVTVVESDTCNGDGDGNIGGGTTGTDLKIVESYLFWQHLADAKLYQGAFTGKAGVSYLDPVMNQNVPPLGLRSGVIDVFYMNSFQQSQQTMVFNNTVAAGFMGRNIIELGTNYGNGASRNGDFVFTSNEARSFDQKIDDGNAANGNVRASTRASACQDTSGNYYSSDVVSGMQSGQIGCALYIGGAF